MRTIITIEVHHLVGDSYSYIGYSGEVVKCKIFSNVFEDTTEGITEFTGAVHGLMYLEKNNLMGDVLVKNPYIKEVIENLGRDFKKHSAKGEKANEFLKRCRRWLLERKSGINIELIP